MEKSTEDRAMLGRVKVEVESTSDYETLAERLRENKSPNHGLAEALVDNVRGLVWVFAITVAGVFFFKWFQENREKDLGEASGRFETVQNIFQEMYAGDLNPAKEGEDLQADRLKKVRGFEDTLSWLKESHSRTTYAQLADYYSALSEMQKGKPESALEKLRAMTPPEAVSRLNPKAKLTRESFLEELALFGKAKALLMIPEKLGEAQELLWALARKGQFVNVESIVLLLDNAKNDAAKEDVKKMALEVLSQRPEFRKVMSSALMPYGIQIPGGSDSNAVIVDE